LGLLPGPLTPSLQESAVRLGAWVPFPRATPLLAHFTHTQVSEPTLRRQTEQAGAAYVAVQTAAVEALERDAPEPPPGPALQQLSVDGAMVPLVGKGVWAEVKTLAIGTVQEPALEDGQPVVHTTDLSYFSRLADHQTFTRLALVETHRRGTTTAQQVVAVNDGALWAQEFVDDHRPDAIRILDWGHAAEYLGEVASACFGADTALAEQWLAVQLRELLEGDPDTVLGKLRGLRDDLTPQAGDPATQAKLATVTTSLHYLEARREQIAYAAFRAAGYPIGSGSVESAHTVVVAARLKGAGMHWAREHVDPMLALRNAVCNDRWAEAWAQIAAELRRQQRARLRAKRQRRRAAAAPPPMPRPHQPAANSPAPRPRRRASARPAPAASHPWRRYGQPLNPQRQQEVVSTVD
jgi:hypothetical protein